MVTKTLTPALVMRLAEMVYALPLTDVNPDGARPIPPDGYTYLGDITRAYEATKKRKMAIRWYAHGMDKCVLGPFANEAGAVDALLAKSSLAPR